MQYTTQQLQGGPKYSHKTRIGNWNEDFELNKIQRGNYEQKKAGDTLPFAKTLTKYQQSYRQVPWSHSADGNLRWNDNIMIQNAQTQGWLVMDIGDVVPNVPEAYQVTSTGAGQNPGPMTRSVYKLTRVEEFDMFGADEFIRYGQQLRIEANEYLFRKKLQLWSYKYTACIKAPVSQKQLAAMSATVPDYDSVWILDHPDPNERFEKQGEIVKAGEPVLIRHLQTCVFLGADCNTKYKNEFGTENEVHCHNHATNFKSQNLWMESDGRATTDVPTKYQKDENVFCLQTSPDAQYARAIDELSKFDMGDFLKDLKAKIFDRSSLGLRSLTRIFKAMDVNGNKNIDSDDFRWGLMDYGIQVSKDEAAELQGAFGADGCINYDSFLSNIRGTMADARAAVVKKAYDKIAADNDGCVRLDNIAQAYDASSDRAVQEGRKSDQDCFMEYMGAWDTQVKDGIVSLDEFLCFYGDQSGACGSDEEFEAMMKAAFRLE